MNRPTGFMRFAALALALSGSVAGRAASNPACALLTKAQVSAVVGATVDDGTAVPTVRDACVWKQDGKPGDSPPLLEVQVLSAQDFDRIKTFRAANAASQSGIGEEARFFRDAITGGLQLILRSRAGFFAIVSWPPHPGVQTPADDDRCKAIETAIARAITEAQH